MSRPYPVARSVALLAVVSMALGCDAARWEQVFSRASQLETRAGWNGGDAALSVPLPSGRNLWLFGDSFVTRVSPSGQRLPDPTGRTLSLGTFIAVHDDAGDPDPDEIRFWASEGGESVEVTGPGAATPSQGFFTHGRLALSVASQDGAWLWPAGAWADGPRVVVALTEVGPCTPDARNTAFECFALPGGVGVDILDTVLVTIPDARGEPRDWLRTARAVRLSDAGFGADTQWGKAFTRGPDGRIYVFGVRQLGTTARYELVEARAHPERLDHPEEWELRVQDGWRTVAALDGAWSDVETVANDVGAFVSVHTATRRGTTRYVLTHTHPAPAGPPGLPVPVAQRRPASHMVFVRVTEWSGELRWGNLDDSTQRIDLLASDPLLASIARDLYETGRCEDATLQSCGTSYHALAHPELSRADEQGDASFLVSYIVPHDARPGSYLESFPPLVDTYRPRFRQVRYDTLRPWCNLAGTSCDFTSGSGG